MIFLQYTYMCNQFVTLFQRRTTFEIDILLLMTNKIALPENTTKHPDFILLFKLLNKHVYLFHHIICHAKPFQVY